MLCRPVSRFPRWQVGSSHELLSKWFQIPMHPKQPQSRKSYAPSRPNDVTAKSQSWRQIPGIANSVSAWFWQLQSCFRPPFFTGCATRIKGKSRWSWMRRSNLYPPGVVRIQFCFAKANDYCAHRHSRSLRLCRQVRIVILFVEEWSIWDACFDPKRVVPSPQVELGFIASCYHFPSSPVDYDKTVLYPNFYTTFS